MDIVKLVGFFIRALLTLVILIVAISLALGTLYCIVKVGIISLFFIALVVLTVFLLAGGFGIASILYIIWEKR